MRDLNASTEDKIYVKTSGVLSGTGGRNRTDTPKERDFESSRFKHILLFLLLIFMWKMCSV